MMEEKWRVSKKEEEKLKVIEDARNSARNYYDKNKEEDINKDI